MCLGIPGKVIEIVDSERGVAKTEVSGVRRNVSTLLLDDASPVRIGDWVLIHVGFALCKIDEKEAQATLRLLDSIAFEDELKALKESDLE